MLLGLHDVLSGAINDRHENKDQKNNDPQYEENLSHELSLSANEPTQEQGNEYPSYNL